MAAATATPRAGTRVATTPRTVIRGRRGTPSADRLPVNDTGLEAQPTKFNSGMWAIVLFVSSEAMFFAALFTTYFYLRARVPEWEPIFGEKPTWLGLPIVITVALISSSVTMQLAVRAIARGDRPTCIRWLAITVFLGALFLSGQAYEYTHLGFLPRDGIFAGVPCLIKDLGPTLKGRRQEFGSAIMQGNRPVQDAFLTTKIRHAGLNLIGRSTTPEFGVCSAAENAFHVTRNPWDPGYSTNGSSAGTAAMVAAGVLPISHGTDGGGSIRIPAGATGNIGLKVSRGVFSLAPNLSDLSGWCRSRAA